jgi:hypothetical protein
MLFPLSSFADFSLVLLPVSFSRRHSFSQVDGDLQAKEFNDIWDKAPKFPDVKSSEERIDVDSFVQVYRDIDDLFEQDTVEDAADEKSNKEPSATSPTSPESVVIGDEQDDDKSLEDELEAIYESISDKEGLVSKKGVREWDEVYKLLDEGLLGEDEFEDIWDKTKKSLGDEDKLDVDGFLSFNVALDSLFELDDEEATSLFELGDDEDADDEVDDEDEVVTPPTSELLVEGGDLSAEELFAALAGVDGLAAKEDLARWSELQEMLEAGDILTSELDTILANTALKPSNKLDLAGFVVFYNAIDELFEDVEDDEDEVAAPVATVDSKTKSSLIRVLDIMNSDKERLPCGLEASAQEESGILNLVNELEQEPTNQIRSRKAAVDIYDLAGTWEMLYSSSSAMKWNKGLSGLGGSVPNGKFGGLVQKLQASRFLTDVEYTEHIDMTPSIASFDVKVTGDWGLRTSTSLFSGDPSIMMIVTPNRVDYGSTSTRGDHWKSLGPLNMLDIAYLDDDFRIMRGSTSVDSIFIFRRLP